MTEHNAENDAGCQSHYGVPRVGTLRCLLVAAHRPFMHYAGDPEHPERIWTWTDEQAVTLGRYRVNDIVRYVGEDPRWVGQQGPVLRADYDRSVPLVVELPGGPRGVGICFRDEHVERVLPPASGDTP